jgi:hypothetical protein
MRHVLQQNGLLSLTNFGCEFLSYNFQLCLYHGYWTAIELPCSSVLFSKHLIRSITIRRGVLLPVVWPTLRGHEKRKYMLRLGVSGRWETRSHECLGREYESDETGSKGRIKEKLKGL